MHINIYLDSRWIVDIYNLDSPKIECELRKYCNLLSEIDSENISLSNSIYNEKCIDSELLINKIYGTENNNLRDLNLLLSVYLGRMTPLNIQVNDIQADGGLYKSDAEMALEGNRSGGLIHNHKPSQSWWNDYSMVLVDNIKEIKKLYRVIPVFNKCSYNDYLQFLELAFPNLYFLDGAKNFSKAEINDATGNKLELFIEHFSYLNDYAQGHFNDNPQEFEKRATINLSRESNSTKKNRDAYKKRLVTIANHDIFCELHTKLNKQFGRIHFHIGTNLPASVNEITKGKLIVGIICNHLPT